MNHCKLLSCMSNSIDFKTGIPPEAICIVPGGQKFQGQFKEGALNTMDKMSLIRRSIPECVASVCYYPCGGHDIIFPTLLTDAQTFVFTGAEHWGSVSKRDPTSEVPQLGYGIGNFDSIRHWWEENGDIGFRSVDRLNAINAYQTGITKDIYVCPFELDASGQISFITPELDHTYHNMALFCNGRDYYYYQISLPCEKKETVSLHNFLSRQVLTPITMIEKAIPEGVFQEAGCLDLFRPSVPCQSVITDCAMETTDEMQPLYMQGFNNILCIDLVPAEDPRNELCESGFGYGSKVFIATSDNRTETSLATTICAKISALWDGASEVKETRLVGISDYITDEERNKVRCAVEQKQAASKKEVEDGIQREIKQMEADLDRHRLTRDANISLNSFTLDMPKSKRLTSSPKTLATYNALNHRLKDKIGDEPMVPILIYPVESKSLDNLLKIIPESWKVKFRRCYELDGPGTFNSLYIPQSKVAAFETLHTHLPQDYTTHKVQPGDSMASLIHSDHNKNEVSKTLFQGCVVLSHSSCLGNTFEPLKQTKVEVAVERLPASQTSKKTISRIKRTPQRSKRRPQRSKLASRTTSTLLFSIPEEPLTNPKDSIETPGHLKQS